MANDRDKLFEKVYFLWKGEGEKRNQSIDWYCERYHIDVEEFRKWYQGISKTVKEVKVVGGPEGEPAEKVAEQEEPRIVVSTTESGRKAKPAIASLTITCGNGLHITRKGMSYGEFIELAQNLKALC